MTKNQKTVVAAIKEMGLLCKVVKETGEYRINLPANREATAYYTDDDTDAMATARSMAKELPFTVQAGRLICKDGAPLFTIHRKDDLSIAEADRLPYQVAAMLNREGIK